MLNKLRSCPFCGKRMVQITKAIEFFDYREIEVECTLCNMIFTHRQYFKFSKNARIAENNDFFTVWNERCDSVEK